MAWVALALLIAPGVLMIGRRTPVGWGVLCELRDEHRAFDQPYSWGEDKGRPPRHLLALGIALFGTQVLAHDESRGQSEKAHGAGSNCGGGCGGCGCGCGCG